MNNSVLQNASILSGRILMSLIFIVAGLNKVSGYAATQGYMESVGLPGVLLPAVIALEVLAGAAILLGFKIRIAAFLLAGFSLMTAIIFHANFSDQMQSILFMKNLAISGGLMYMVAFGAGKWSIDKE